MNAIEAPSVIEVTADEVAKAKLQRDYPGWSIIRADRGRWWATRNPQPGEVLSSATVGDVSDDTPELLRERQQAADKVNARLARLSRGRGRS